MMEKKNHFIINEKGNYRDVPKILKDHMDLFETHISLLEVPYDDKDIKDKAERILKNSLEAGYIFDVEIIDSKTTIIYRFCKDEPDRIVGFIDNKLVFCFTNIFEKKLEVGKGYEKIQNYLIEKGFKVNDDYMTMIELLT